MTLTVCTIEADGSRKCKVYTFNHRDSVPCDSQAEAMELGVCWFTDPEWRGLDELGLPLLSIN